MYAYSVVVGILCSADNIQTHVTSLDGSERTLHLVQLVTIYHVGSLPLLLLAVAILQQTGAGDIHRRLLASVCQIPSVDSVLTVELEAYIVRSTLYVTPLCLEVAIDEV